MATNLQLEVDATRGDNDGNLREAPNNIQAEQALLGALLTNNEAMNHIGGELLAEHFYVPIHGEIFEAITRFHDKGMIANPVTLKHHFNE